MPEHHGPLGLARACVNALELHKQLPADATLTPEQRATLAGWAGWGPLADVVDTYVKHRLTGGWTDLVARVSELLTPQEETAAKEATATSYYTPPTVVRAVWRILTDLGFTGGRMLEPGCGSGRFIAATPGGCEVEWIGVELDPTTAAIAARLHPHAKIINRPLERTSFRVNAFSAVIGNVPFAEVAPYDATWPDDAGFRPRLHNYFIWRALKNLHPGGLVAVVTSRYTMDAIGSEFREFISREAEFVGAIRLPTGGLGEATKAVADIIVLRKREVPADEGDAGEWAIATNRPDLQTSLNLYWDSHPEMVLGTISPKGGARYGHVLEVTPDGDLEFALESAVDRLVDRAVARGQVWTPPAADSPADVEILLSAEKEGSFHLDDKGRVTQVLDGEHVRVEKPSDELKHLIMLRDAANDLFTADADPTKTDVEVEPIRAHVRALYESYVAKWGPLNRCKIVEGKRDEETGLATLRRITPKMGGFRGSDTRPGDPDYVTLLALELWDDDTGEAAPNEILLRRVNRPPQRPSRADSPGEAVALCLDEHGRIHLDTLARLLGCTAEQVPGRCEGLIFQDPETAEWVTAEEYLSGPVRAKLAAARRAAADDPARWGGNVAALEQVQPVDLGPSEIEARLGSPWLPADIIRDFIVYLFDLSAWNEADKVVVKHEPLTASWEVTAPPARKRTSATTRWGTARVNAVDLIQGALNGSAPVVKDLVEDLVEGGHKRQKTVKNHAETQLAEERLREIQERFAYWVWSDPKRADHLCKIYNDRFNGVRLRKYDGSHLTFPGMASNFTPYPHQRDMAARIVSSAATVSAHTVGAGKTGQMIMAAMTMKRLGLTRKPMVAVPNHLLEQVSAEFRRIYPSARVLMVTPADLNPARRRYFAAKVAAADWDMIVVTHQQFTSIPVSPAIEADFLAEQIEEFEEALCAADGTLDNSRTAKRVGKHIMKLKARYAELTDPRRKGHDTGLYFDQLGVDFVMVDEFHYFKNLACATRMEGFSMPSSKRAEDLFMKISWLRRRNPGGRCFAGFTGTPISNTLAEAYTLLRYAFPLARLRELGLAAFDAFAGQFIRYTSKIEVSPDGSGFRMHRRPGEFVNVPELRLLLCEFMDVRTRSQLKLAGPGRVVREVVAVDPQPELKPFTNDLVFRADQIRMGRVKPKDDNMLAVCTDGRKAALWLPLVGIHGTGPSKPDAVADRIARIYHEWKDYVYPDSASGDLFGGGGAPGALQMVFCDFGTPGKYGDQVYGHIRDRLVEKGVPRRMIRFAHDYDTPEAKKALYKECREGGVAVLLTSTEKGGTGVNVQDRLVAIHHVDAPWRPADVEQRDGRGIRPGNLNSTLWIIRYVTKESFDAYMWQGLERKASFISQVLNGELDARTVTDVMAEDVIDYSHIKALSTGQELVMELAKVQAEVARLRNLAAAHERDRRRIRNQYKTWRDMAYDAEANARNYLAIADIVASSPRVYSRWGTEVVDEAEVANLLAEAGRESRAQRRHVHAGMWRGVELRTKVTWHGQRAEVAVEVALPHGSKWTTAFTAKIGALRVEQEAALLKMLDSALDEAADRAAREKDRAEYYRQEAAATEGEITAEFEHADELAEALRRRDEIEAEIAEEVAPAGVSAVETPEAIAA